MITALAGALIGAPTAAMAASYDEDVTGTANWKAAGVGYNGVIDGRAAGTNVLTVDGLDMETFCIEYGVPAANSGSFTTTPWSDSKIAGLDKASDIAARHNAIAGKIADQRGENAAAQLAIWHFTDKVDVNAVPNEQIRDRALALIAAAQARPAVSGEYSVHVDTQSYLKDDALRTKVDVLVFDDAGKPATATNITGVRVTSKGAPIDGKESILANVVDGKATFDFPAPEEDVNGTVTIYPAFDAGTVWAPEGDMQLVMGTQRMLGTIVLDTEVDLLEEPFVEPTPEPTTDPAPEPTVAPVVPAETPPPAEPVAEAAPVAEEKPTVLPHTGALGTAGLVAGLLAVAGAAGVTAWRIRSRA